MSRFLLWLDIETTGLEIEKDHEILELAAVPTNLELEYELKEQPDGTRGWHYLVATSVDPGPLADPAVATMHASNGLWSDLNNSGAPIWWIDQHLSTRIEEWTLGEKFWLAGSGVAQFDIHWVRHFMPRTSLLMDYRTIDVGQMDRFLKHVVQVDDTGRSTEKPHRAMPDVEEALTFARDLKQRVDLTAPVN